MQTLSETRESKNGAYFFSSNDARAKNKKTHLLHAEYINSGRLTASGTLIRIIFRRYESLFFWK